MERTREGAEVVWDGGVGAGWSATGIVYIIAQLGWVGTGEMLRGLSTDAERHTPGAKAHFISVPMRPKAEALGYLEAKAMTKEQRQKQVLRLRRRMTILQCSAITVRLSGTFGKLRGV